MAPKHNLSKENHPLSYGQQSLWFIYKMSPNSGCYNINYAWVTNSKLSVSALNQSIQILTNRHPQLRNQFWENDGVPFQSLAEYPKTSAEVIDGYDWNDDQIDQFLQHEALQPFILETGCYFRWKLIHLSDNQDLLSITGPHISSDLWSHARLMNEFRVVYNEFLNDSFVSLPEVGGEYFDFINYQQKYIESPACEEDFRFWKEKLTNNDSIIDLPSDFVRSSDSCFDFKTVENHLSQINSRYINNLAFTNSSTPYALFMAVFYVLVYRLTAQEDISIGTPSPGRNKRDFQDIVGYFVNTLVIRQKLNGNRSFLDLLNCLLGTIKKAREHQNIPFSLLVERLQPKREKNKHPFFNVMFSWEEPNSFLDREQPLVSLDSKGEESWAMGSFSMRLIQKAIVDDFDLSLRVRAIDGDYTTIWAYNPNLFKKESVERFAGHFETLFKNILKDPNQPIEQISILSRKERDIITVDWNKTATEYPRNQNVHAVFEKYARDFPTSIALEFEEIQMSYSELNKKSNKLAHYFVSENLSSEEPVVVCMDRSFEMILSILAIIKAGGVYVPIDPEYPPERIQYMLNNSQAKFVLTQVDYTDLFNAPHLTVICADRNLEEFKSFSSDNPNIQIGAKRLLYILYTSGSTGDPKGVCVTHRNAIRLVKNTNYMEFGPDETILMFAPLTFDLSTFEIWGALLNGGKLSIFHSYMPALNELADFIYEKHITSLWLTSGLFHKIAEEHLDKLKNVKQLIVGGDIISVPHAQKTLKTLKNTHFINGYGPTENATFTCCYSINNLKAIQHTVPIGKAIANTKVYILDKNLNPVPIGVTGELCTSGDGLARGYLNKPKKTAERFVQNPFSDDPTEKLYKTGDLAKYLPDGNIEFLGRVDFQVKIRGFRIEPGEIEICLSKFPGVKDVIVIAKEITPGNKQLIAYLVSNDSSTFASDELRKTLKAQLPDHMIPSAFITLSSLPLTHNGKLDRKKLPLLGNERPVLKIDFKSANSETEEQLVSIWKSVLHLEKVGIKDNFFDLGGNSILMLQVHSRLPSHLQTKVKLLDLLEYPTIESLTNHLDSEIEEENQPGRAFVPKKNQGPDNEIAVIAMTGRFPGAESIEELWQNLLGGVESIAHFTEEELVAAEVNREDLIHPDYVKSKSVIRSPELFDSHFFGFSPKEADITDPQQRLFLECSWEALELAGYDPDRYPGKIGVFGGSGFNSYRFGLENNATDLNFIGNFPIMIGNEKDFLCTRVAYKLNLKGPAVVTQSACSTSLLAVHTACQSLKNHECDMALAGGVSVIGSSKEGYFYEKGGILSPDGHCRPFDALGQGTVPGQGVGIVVLKRLEEAKMDGDTIHAVIKGSAINNDGSMKAGYTAPGVEGQVKVIREALENANVNPSTIRYVETHGTGTPLGDPIEIRALSKAYSHNPDETGVCALGAVKSNLGHLDAAAGVTGLIKAVLTLKHKQLVPPVNFENPHPGIDFENSPFFIPSHLKDLFTEGEPIRAGVSSFGIGGTNVHAILEEGPVQPRLAESVDWHILPLSAKTKNSLQKSTNNLHTFLASEKKPVYRMTDIAYTLQTGRQEFNHRCILMCRNREDAIRVLDNKDPFQMTISQTTASNRPVAFMFPGQGSQYVDMGRELYENEPLFNKEMDNCFDILKRQAGLNIKPIIYPNQNEKEDAKARIVQTFYTQPVLFAIEYATAKLWMAYGVQPQCMIGHSIGEYTAACISGVMKLEEALRLVMERGRLIQGLPEGAMLSVRLSEREIRPLLSERLALAAVNTPNRCVLSGDWETVTTLQNQLEETGKDCVLLHTSHAFHSNMLEPVLQQFKEAVATIKFNDPSIPYVSNVTGDWIKRDQILDPDYWVNHLRSTVQFSNGIRQILRKPDIALLEVGPGKVLRTLSVQNLEKTKDHVVVSSIRHLTSRHSDREYILASLGRLWLHGVKINWEKLNSSTKRFRVPLPTYPFEHRRHWIEGKEKSRPSAAKTPNIGDWFYLPTWKQAYHSHRFSEKIELPYAMKWLVFVDRIGFGKRIATVLRANDQQVIEITIGSQFRKVESHWYQLNPSQETDYEELASVLSTMGYVPQKVIHMWNVIGQEYWGLEYFNSLQELGFYSIINLIKAFENSNLKRLMQIQVVTDNMQEVQGSEQLSPGKSTLLALVNSLHLEYPHLYCQNVDISIPGADSKEADELIPRLIREIGQFGDDRVVAYRNEYRWVRAFEKRYWEPLSQNAIQLKQGGVYLITGGLGNIGMIIAEYLAKTAMAKIVLLGRSPFPQKSDWQKCIELQTESETVIKKIERFKQLERYGAKVLVLEADVSDFTKMEAAIAETEESFGQINGVFHAAGEIGRHTFHKINKLTPEICAQQFKPKVDGLFVLEKIFKSKQVSFIMMFSSLSCLTGGIDFTAYAAANQFMDSFAKLLDRYSPIRWITINWDGWKTDEEQDLYFLMSPEEGTEVLHRILSQNFTTQLIISTIDLFNRLGRLKSKSSMILPEREPSQNTSLPLTQAGEEEVYIAPRNDTEHKIAIVWQDFLNINRISIHEDFFELGGDSLMAVRLTAQLNEVFPGAVSDKSILEESTIADLARAIQKKLDSQESGSESQRLENYQSLVRIQKGDPCNNPLFLVHPGGGFVFNYIGLARKLNKDQPVFALQSRGIKDIGALLTTVEEIADFYISELLDLQTQGPYQLGGASFGGMVAYEMSRKLKSMGHKVNLLMMIDTPGPVYELPKKVESDAEIVQMLFGRSLQDAGDHFESQNTDDLIEQIVKIDQENETGFNLSREFVKTCVLIAKTHLNAMSQYQPKASSFDILFFKHTESLPEYSKHPESPWIDLAEAGVTVIKIPGNHYTMNMEPNISRIASNLNAKLGVGG